MASNDNTAPAAHKRDYTVHSDETRAIVVRMWNNGHSSRWIAEETGLPRQTVQSIVAVAQEEHRTEKKPRGGNHHTIYSAAVRDYVVLVQDGDAALRLSDIADAVEKEFQVRPALSTIYDMLQKAGFTTKHLQPYCDDRNTAATKEKRKVWVQEVGSRLTADNSVFIDESPFSMTLLRTRGRSRKGQAALGVIPAIRSKNHSVIAALSPSRGLLYFEIKVSEPEEEFVSKRSSKKKKPGPRGVTRDVFRSFLINLFASSAFQSLSQSHPSLTLLFDNARIHKGDIDETIFQAGYNAAFLPPYSPELNPIELAFSTWKFAYRVHYPQLEEQVDPAIRASSASITPAKSLHDFAHTQSLYPACLALEDI